MINNDGIVIEYNVANKATMIQDGSTVIHFDYYIDTLDPYDTQAFNRYSYVRNNPLKYTDPSGHSWLSKIIKVIIVVIIAIVVTYITAGLASGWVATWGSTFFTAATGTLTAAGSFAVGAIAGAAGGFASGFTGTLMNGGSIEDAFSNGFKGALAGAITGGIAKYYGDIWHFERVLAHGVGGGAASEIMGGKFKDGFALASVLALATWGYQEMVKMTNALKLKSVNGDTSKIVKNMHGELDTTGARGVGRPYRTGEVKSWLASFGMAPEGQQLESFHSGFNRLVNWVSKTHDFFNSWHYNWETGYFQPFTNRIGAELFEVYSFVGMPIAGAYTVAAVWSTEITIYDTIYREVKKYDY